jgi:DtxR family transcriptional regulator, Mn-dependent transcriptional regulator
VNRGEEDYLKVLYELQTADEEPISNSLLSLTLDHSVQSVNEMIKKLAAKDYVTYTPYQGSRLTQRGTNEAVSLLRKHRLWECFLFDKLHYSWEEIHEEAELLEHTTSQKLTERLYAFLGSPAYCPHGNPIPTIAGTMPKLFLMSLMETKPGRTYSLRRVVDDQEILAYLRQIGLKLGDPFQVVRQDPVSDIITLKLRDNHVAIGYKVARLLYVEAHTLNESKGRMED